MAELNRDQTLWRSPTRLSSSDSELKKDNRMVELHEVDFHGRALEGRPPWLEGWYTWPSSTKTGLCDRVEEDWAPPETNLQKAKLCNELEKTEAFHIVARETSRHEMKRFEFSSFTLTDITIQRLTECTISNLDDRL